MPDNNYLVPEGKETIPGARGQGAMWGRRRYLVPDNGSPNYLGIGGVEWYSTIRRLGYLNNCRREPLGIRLVS